MTQCFWKGGGDSTWIPLRPRCHWNATHGGLPSWDPYTVTPSCQICARFSSERRQVEKILNFKMKNHVNDVNWKQKQDIAKERMKREVKRQHKSDSTTERKATAILCMHFHVFLAWFWESNLLRDGWTPRQMWPVTFWSSLRAAEYKHGERQLET